jgi:hypothetical protein
LPDDREPGHTADLEAACAGMDGAPMTLD